MVNQQCQNTFLRIIHCDITQTSHNHGKGKEISNSVKEIILEQWKAGESYKKISTNLRISFTTIALFIARYKSAQTVENKIRSGAPCRISPRSLRKMKRRSKLIQKLYSQSCKKIHQHQVEVLRTISNELHRNELKSRSPRKTPLLTKRHRVVRLKSASDQMTKQESFWESVLWSDETKIELFGRNSRNHVWRKDGTALARRTQFPQKSSVVVTSWFGDVSLEIELGKYK